METNKKRGISFLFHMLGQGVEWFETIILSLSVLAMASLVIANVFARTFFTSIHFVEELTEMFTILITFTGVSYAVRKARHIRMGAFFDAAPFRLQKIMIFVICVISGVVMFLMATYAYGYMSQARLTGQVTPSLRLPYWIFLIIVPIGFFSAGIQYIRTIVKNVSERDVWLSPEQQGDYELEELQQIADSYGDVAEELSDELKEKQKQDEDLSDENKKP